MQALCELDPDHPICGVATKLKIHFINMVSSHLDSLRVLLRPPDKRWPVNAFGTACSFDVRIDLCPPHLSIIFVLLPSSEDIINRHTDRVFWLKLHSKQWKLFHSLFSRFYIYHLSLHQVAGLRPSSLLQPHPSHLQVTTVFSLSIPTTPVSPPGNNYVLPLYSSQTPLTSR